MPLGNNLFAAKMKYLQRGGGCCKKKGKKVDKIDMVKNPPPPIFFSLKESILIRNYLRNENKAVYTAFVAPRRPKSKSVTDGRTDSTSRRRRRRRCRRRRVA